MQRVVSLGAQRNTILGSNFLDPLPGYLLIILQQLEAVRPIDTSAGSHGHLYEALITTSLARGEPPLHDSDTRLNYLSELAHHFQVAEVEEFDSAQLQAWHEQFCREYAITLNHDQVLRELCEAGILLANNGTVSFRYRYAYYFFVGRYLRDHITEPDTRNVVTELSTKLHHEDSANIMVFLCHLSRDPFILDTVLSRSRNLLKSALRTKPG